MKVGGAYAIASEVQDMPVPACIDDGSFPIRIASLALLMTVSYVPLHPERTAVSYLRVSLRFPLEELIIGV